MGEGGRTKAWREVGPERNGMNKRMKEGERIK